MDPNVWAVLSGVFAMVALSHTMLVRTLRGEVKRLDQKVDMKVDGLEKQLTSKINNVDGKSEARGESWAPFFGFISAPSTSGSAPSRRTCCW